MAALDVKNITGSFDVVEGAWASFEILADAGNENLFKYFRAKDISGTQVIILGEALTGQIVNDKDLHMLDYTEGVLVEHIFEKNWIISDTNGLKIWVKNIAGQVHTIMYQIVMVEAK